jgi:type IV pilus assembly protein PilA
MNILQKLRSSRGFTLIELMIVVAIIGILAAIAIPNFTRFQSKSKQSEAKTNLKALYTAAKSYLAEKDTFDVGMDIMGFQPEPGYRYTYNYASTAGTKVYTGTKDGTCVGCTSAVTATAFTACACGNIDNDTTIDSWSMNDANNLANSQDDVSL